MTTPCQVCTQDSMAASPLMADAVSTACSASAARMRRSCGAGTDSGAAAAAGAAASSCPFAFSATHRLCAPWQEEPRAAQSPQQAVAAMIGLESKRNGGPPTGHHMISRSRVVCLKASLGNLWHNAGVREGAARVRLKGGRVC